MSRDTRITLQVGLIVSVVLGLGAGSILILIDILRRIFA